MKSETNAGCRGIPQLKLQILVLGISASPLRTVHLVFTGDLLLPSSKPHLPTAHGVTHKTLPIFETLCPSTQRNVQDVSTWTCTAGSHHCLGKARMTSVGLGKTLVIRVGGAGALPGVDLGPWHLPDVCPLPVPSSSKGGRGIH